MPLTTARRSDRQRTEAEAFELIKNAAFGHLATVSADGQPYVIPVNHVLYGTTIFIHAALQGQKLLNIAHEPRVCFEVSHMLELIPGPVPCAYGVKYESAVAFGNARLSTDAKEKKHALSLIAKKYTGNDGPLEDNEVEKVVVIAVDVSHATCKARR